MRRMRLLSGLLAVAALTGCATAPATTPAPATTMDPVAASPSPTEADAVRFVEQANERLYELGVRASHAAWVAANFITFDTQRIAAERDEIFTSAFTETAKEAARFDGLRLSYDTRRQLELLKTGLVAPAPADARKATELSELKARLEAMYGAGKFCPPGRSGEDCLDIQQITRIFAGSRDPAELMEVWAGWRTISPSMRPLYQRFVELSNEGSRELGYRDTGVLWRSKYDMPPDEFAAEMDRLWLQVKPLYDTLHCYVRAELNQEYGDAVVPLDQPIRADLLGNIWAQDWSNVYELVAPPAVDPGFDLTERLRSKNVDAREMVRIGERFFTSLGFDPLPDTFWERSLFTQPVDHEAVCHASAWNVDEENDLRIKMCIEPTAEDFKTIHHELGHNFYQRAYNQLPYLYRQSANDGFHEALGDTIALSVTPPYLRQIGLIPEVPDPSKDLGLLMRDALESVAFLPFGLLIDKWRWGVFSGEISPAEYNRAWWELRTRYQGIRPPVERTEEQFDPGAKFHIPGNTPYSRYFLARILQFQFHRSLCETIGFDGPLNRCSIYGNREAGRRLNEMMEMGISRPWPDALEALTGKREMDATAIIGYFAPLKQWLDQQNRGRRCGW
ncbi:MAG TPA: M2 family metallopeptidase [Thermoanaerobaculia bacterium]|nr:M2 family metallopeptidase [Thermoanaerobaculia bacterium]